MPDLTDKEILKGCLAGDRQVQEEFVIHFSSLVYSAIQGTIKLKNIAISRNDIEDLHNTVFVKLFEKNCKKLKQYKGKNGCSLSSWVRLIAARTVIDHNRKTKDAFAQPEKSRNFTFIEDFATNISGPLKVVEQKEQYHLLEEGLKSLLPRDRMFLELHCFKGLPINQVAGILNISMANAYSLKTRATARLKKIIQKKEGFP